jgi:hypothetical protein
MSEILVNAKLNEKNKSIKLATDVESFQRNVSKKNDDGFFDTKYGFITTALAATSVLFAVSGADVETQSKFLKRGAKDIIRNYGHDIVPVLRDELKLSLTEEDIKNALSENSS